jgi:formylglycine-generating enzyme required for sulfatase activity
MPAGYFIAVLLCAGDNCDLVRTEPGIEYPTYQACSAATARQSARIGEIASRLQIEQGRQGDIVCLRDRLALVEADEQREAVGAVSVREQPDDSAREIASIVRGEKVHVIGILVGIDWIRVALKDGRSGFAHADRVRRIEPAQAPSIAAGQQPAAAAPSRAASDVAPAAPSVAARPPTTAPPSEAPHQGGQRQGGAREFRDCDQCPTMVALAGGTFEMGSTRDPSERPTHRVAVGTFALGKFEVTHREWRACVAAGACTLKPNPSADERLPMMNVSWDDATQFAAWLAQLTGKPYRLPTETEWEYAARAGTSTPFPWGPQPGVAQIDCSGCGTARDTRLPALAGSFPPNPWGLQDMLGGVAEWVEDCWHKSYDGAPANGSAWTTPRCSQHVLRGGSWKNPPADVTVSARNFYDASVRYAANGLRVAVALGDSR